MIGLQKWRLLLDRTGNLMVSREPAPEGLGSFLDRVAAGETIIVQRNEEDAAALISMAQLEFLKSILDQVGDHMDGMGLGGDPRR